MLIKKLIYISIVFIIILVSINCDDKKSQWKDNPAQLLSSEEVRHEINIKIKRVKDFLNEEGLFGMLLTQVRNFNWITAGAANNQIVLNKDIGAASLLIMNDGKNYVICSGSEAGRLMDESLRDLGYELKIFDWFNSNPEKDIRGKIIDELAGGGKIGSDTNFPSTVSVGEKFARLRYSLTDTEIKKYRWLGKETTTAVAEVCRKIKPGMSEFELEYLTACELRSRGIFPTVLLTAVDQRIYNYRHALPAGKKLDKYAMINVVAEKWGMSIAVTRFVHFGPLPEELSKKIKACAEVNAHFQAATIPGKPLAQIFDDCKKWYEEAGYKDEWQKHHQGGAIGYNAREFKIYPGVDGIVEDNQAFAWNPTITGAKIEDTFIAYKDHIEVVTISDDWPMIQVSLNGKVYLQPDILIR